MAAVDSFQLLYAEIRRSCSGYYEAAALLGALYAASRALRLLRGCCRLVAVHFLPRLMPRKPLSQRFGAWAVCYGAAEPVARAYAEELARNGVSLVLVAQDAAAVRDAAASLSQRYGVETVAVAADFSLGPAAGKLVQDAVRGRDVGFLVTSVDDGGVARRPLAEAADQELLDLLNRNVAGAALLARLLLPGMAARGRGAVVNISPGDCWRPTPGRAAIAAAAAFVERLSAALQLEHRRSGVVVQSLTPLQIRSGRRPPWGAGWLVPPPDVYARHAVATLGVSSRTTGYWPHALQLGLVRKTPDWVWPRLLFLS